MREVVRGIVCDVCLILMQDGLRQGLKNVSRLVDGAQVVYVGLGRRDRMRAFYRHGVKLCRPRRSSGIALRPLGHSGCGLGGRAWKVCRKSCIWISFVFSMCEATERKRAHIMDGGTS